jgi:DNA polymerase I-like protein with 3'-5' exonuclease and polymerase domains
MKILVMDIEADNLLLDASVIHCVVTTDPSTGETHRFRPHEIVKAYRHLQTADRLVAHNGVLFDVPVLERLVGVPNSLGKLPKCLDTLLLSRLLWPDSKGEHPAGGHSLKNWGEFLRNHKGEQPTDWSTFTEEMLDYCEQDVDVTVDLYNYLIPRLNGLQEAVSLEHRVAEIICKQIQNGFPVDMEKVVALHRELSTRLAELNDQFSHIPPWVEEEELKTPQYWEDPLTGEKYETKGEVRGKGSGAIKDRLVRGPNKIKRTEILFSPSTPSHKARLFVEKYGWKPKKLGAPNKWFPKGAPSVDKDVIATLDYPEAKTFQEIAKVNDLINKYTSSWIEYERNGRIHGDVFTIGCATMRMAHSKPPMNVPKVGKPWGFECRDCFTHREGWVLVGADASGLQERGLAHYMAQYDGGEYARAMESGTKDDWSDSHSLWCKALGYNPWEEVDFGSTVNNAREQAKTHKYATMFGGGVGKQASILGISYKEMLAKRDGMYARLPGLKKVKKYFEDFAKKHGYIIGLDGRKVPIHSVHMALAGAFQCFEAVVMKKALCIFYDKMVQEFGPHGERWGLCCANHDEEQWECEPDIAEQSGQMFVDSIRESGEHFRLNIRLDGEYKVGGSWALTH